MALSLRLRKFEVLRVGDLLTMENSFSEFCEGVYLDIVWKRVPIDDNQEIMP